MLTKLDGTAKGGIVIAVQRELGVPVKLVGLGEGADDLAPFDAEEFVDALLAWPKISQCRAARAHARRNTVFTQRAAFVIPMQHWRAHTETLRHQSVRQQVVPRPAAAHTSFGGFMDTGDTAWILASSALVLLMTPGLAFFYGGMVRSKTVLNMMMMSFLALAIVPVLWVLYGYSLAFSPDGNQFLGGFKRLGLDHFGLGTAYGTIPEYVFVAFQLMFAIITVALISGAIADRAKFGAWALFIAIWVTVVYFPVAHWVFDFGEDGGWIATKLEAFDFAGGTAVHINAGAAGLALALVLGKRVGWKRDPMRPHNLPFVLLGAGLLWFGWFGFNAGSAVGANGLAAGVRQHRVATAAAILGWLLVEVVRDKKATSLGGASGAVAGLVAITPAGAFSPLGSIVLGVIAGILVRWPSASSTSSATTTRSTSSASTWSAASSARC